MTVLPNRTPEEQRAHALISILIAAHDAETHIGATLTAALSQTWTPTEVIVVDDGSRDATARIVEQFKEVRLIRQDNRGAPAARNRAFYASRGAYVLFLDADDLIGPDHLAALRSAIKDEPDCIGLGQWDRFHHDPTEATFPLRSTYANATGAEWIAMDWAHARPMTQCGMALIPRTLLEGNGGWNETLRGAPNDDFEFFARIIARSGGVRFAQGAKLYYRSGVSGSLSGRRGRMSAEAQLRSLLMGIAEFLAAEDSAYNRRLSANILRDFEYGQYPWNRDLRARARARIGELGGASIEPDGPPGFHMLRPWIGWKAARWAQLLAERCGLNRVGRRRSMRMFGG